MSPEDKSADTITSLQKEIEDLKQQLSKSTRAAKECEIVSSRQMDRLKAKFVRTKKELRIAVDRKKSLEARSLYLENLNKLNLEDVQRYNDRAERRHTRLIKTCKWERSLAEQEEPECKIRLIPCGHYFCTKCLRKCFDGSVEIRISASKTTEYDVTQRYNSSFSDEKGFSGSVNLEIDAAPEEGRMI
ncbi:hypothetical protein B0H16DRAFT_1475302 [Mycena metata]|uniref:Zinc finger C3HC4 RING-type domain-containing protein n=1 Tax=Mycena metata TaxID=1033252 RepID=A0AAD7MI89_9AGAR|nr:hypothetical protein B0H16DRAFT_1475302 [Mycena metata]